jgi:hypothetical protein
MHAPKRLPPELDGRPFTFRDALTRGVTRERTRSSDLDRPFRGIRAPQAPDRSFLQSCEAYAAGMADDQYFSHLTAARLLGLPLPWRLQDSSLLHVTSKLPRRAPRARGVVGHHAEPKRVHGATVEGLRITSAIQTWCDLATVLSVRELIVIGDALVRRKQPLATLAELRQAVEGWGGRRGARKQREALEAVRAGVDSPKETEVRLIIVGAGLPEPSVNATIRNARGEFIALGDLVYLGYRILVEYDGAHHFAGDEQFYKDIDRLDAVMEEKWRVVRLNKTHLRRPEVIVAKVRTALLASGWHPDIR